MPTPLPKAGFDRRDAAIFALSFAVLLLELLLTRVFSVVMFHHFSFLAVSLAMTGLGVGGLVVNLLPSRFRDDNIDTTAPWLTLAFGLSVLLTMGVAFHTPVRLQDDAENWRRISLILASSLAPFALAGLVLAHLLTFGGSRIPRLYFADLAGAAVACLVMVTLTAALGAPSALLAAAAAGVASGTLLAMRSPGGVACAVLALLLAAGSLANTQSAFLDIRFAKGGRPSPALVTRWNSYSRVEVRGTAADLDKLRRPVSWGFSSRLSVQARELHLLYDADAMTQIVGYDGNPAHVDYLLWDVTSAAHHARTNPGVLVIGAGGGRDVLAALAAGSTNVTGVEINDVTVDLMQTRFRDYTHGLYDGYPGVRIHNEDGRSYVRRSTDRYDLIQASLVDTWAASSAGAYSLTENSLYTVEAFLDYFDKLAPGGMVSFSRWYADPPTEVVRTIALAREALRRRGVADPASHVAVVRTDPRQTLRPSLATILVKPDRFTAEEIRNLARWAGEMLFDTPVLPPQGGIQGSEPALAPLFADDEAYRAFASTLPYDISPTTDDRPFFFDRVPLLGWMAFRIGLPAPAWATSSLPLGSRTLLMALAFTAANAFALFLLPLLAGSRGSGPGRTDTIPWIAYFAFLGLGYIAVEIVLIQRLALLLGQPSYALSVVLCSMLASSALGALFAERFGESPVVLKRILGAVLVVLALGAAVSGPLTSASRVLAEPLRILVAVGLVAPTAFVMGMPFPSGLRQASRHSAATVSWAWAVNGAMSVLGSVVAVLASMTAGFTASMLVGWASYAGALVMVVLLERSTAPANPFGSPAAQIPER